MPLPFPLALLLHNAILKVALPLTLRLLMELLTGTMLASLSHDRLSRYSKASAKSRNKTKICYFHCLPFLPIFCYRNRAGVMVKIYVQLQWHGYALYTWV